MIWQAISCKIATRSMGWASRRLPILSKKSDLDESATTYTKPKITKIALKSGKRAYRFSIPSKTPYNGLIYEDQNAEIGIAINKTLPLRMLADSPANSQNIEAFKERGLVAVYENKAKGADGSQAFCVIGYEQGAHRCRTRRSTSTATATTEVGAAT